VVGGSDPIRRRGGEEEETGGRDGNKLEEWSLVSDPTRPQRTPSWAARRPIYRTPRAGAARAPGEPAVGSDLVGSGGGKGRRRHCWVGWVGDSDPYPPNSPPGPGWFFTGSLAGGPVDRGAALFGPAPAHQPPRRGPRPASVPSRRGSTNTASWPMTRYWISCPGSSITAFITPSLVNNHSVPK